MRKPKPKNVGLGAKVNDDESRAILYDGASISQLSTLFDMDNREVSRRIRNIPPSGERMGYPIYAIKDVATELVPPSGNIEETIKRMSPKDLPPALTKEFWAAQHARLKFEEDSGDLWRTEKVIETWSEVLKNIRMTILLFQDQIEKQSQLSARQREIIQQMVDGLLNELADNLVERFKNTKDDDESDEL